MKQIVISVMLLLALAAFGRGMPKESPEITAVENAPQAYGLHVADQDGAPVPGVYVNFCTDTACVMCFSDEDGLISFDGAPDRYHVQVLKVPEGYSLDEESELYTDPAYGEWTLRLRKD